MKILLIHQYFLEKEDGGGSRFNEMSRVWGEEGHEITVLSGMYQHKIGAKNPRYKGKYFFKDNQFYNNVDVVRCHVSDQYDAGFIGRLWAYISFVFSSVYAGIFKVSNKYDVIVVTSPPLFVGITGYLLSKIKRVPFVFKVRDLWPESAIDTGVVKNKLIIKFSYWFEKFIYNKAKLINVLTPAFRDKLVENKNVPEEKIIFIPNAADFTLAEKIQKDFDAVAYKADLGFADKFVITYVGAHGKANHLIQLIDVAEKLRDTNIVFQLIGTGPEKQELVKQTKQRNLNNIIFREQVTKEEVFKYLLASDAGTSVLKNIDTFKTIYSNKTFDYMSCKKPIILLIDGVSRKLINDAQCGMYAEPENIENIVMITKKIAAKESKEIIEMGENGFKYAKIHFDRILLAKEYLGEIKSII